MINVLSSGNLWIIYPMAQKKIDTNIKSQKIDADMLSLVVQYDKQFFPEDRMCFIQQWITEAETLGVVLLSTGDDSGGVPKTHKTVKGW